MLERQSGPAPGGGAVAQRVDLVRDPGVDQRLGADDAPGATGAVDHDPGPGPGHRLQAAVGELGPAPGVEAARDVVVQVLPVRAAVQDHHLLAGRAPPRDGLRVDGGRAEPLLDPLPEGLGAHVGAGVEPAARGGPARGATVQDGDRAVSEPVQDGPRGLRQGGVVRDQHHRGLAARDQQGDALLQVVEGEAGAGGEVPLRPVLRGSQVEDRDLQGGVVEQLAHPGGGDERVVGDRVGGCGRCAGRCGGCRGHGAFHRVRGVRTSGRRTAQWTVRTVSKWTIARKASPVSRPRRGLSAGLGLSATRRGGGGGTAVARRLATRRTGSRSPRRPPR